MKLLNAGYISEEQKRIADAFDAESVAFLQGFGRRLHQLRKAAGLSQAQLGELCGISQTTVCNWERLDYITREKPAFPSVENLLRLCIFFGIDFGSICGLYAESTFECNQIFSEYGLTENSQATLMYNAIENRTGYLRILNAFIVHDLQCEDNETRYLAQEIANCISAIEKLYRDSSLSDEQKRIRSMGLRYNISESLNRFGDALIAATIAKTCK